MFEPGPSLFSFSFNRKFQSKLFHLFQLFEDINLKEDSQTKSLSTTKRNKQKKISNKQFLKQFFDDLDLFRDLIENNKMQMTNKHFVG